MRYEEPVYRPPSEAGSLLIQATLGCPHNKCTFCGMYKGKKFRIRRVEEIKEDLRTARDFYGEENVRTVFFPDGNTIIMRTPQLVEIFDYTRELFPKLERITSYGSAKFILLKSPAEWKELREAGLRRLHAGIESGDAVLLERLKKGATPGQMVEAGRRVKDAGLELSEYILVGIGGMERSKEHALGSAKVLNAIDPDFIRLRTWVPVPAAPLYADYESGDFKLLDPYEALEETRLLLENLDVNSWFLSDHVSNFANLNGRLPGAKEKLLSQIDEALKLPPECFRESIIQHL
jgi:radical SAM superfamily enzyme YgiQ (UPF0313 family)